MGQFIHGPVHRFIGFWLFYWFLTILDHIFQFLGLGRFLSSDSDTQMPDKPWNDHNCCLESEVYQIERGVFIISLYAMGLSTVPACVPACQKCASVPEGHPRSVWASPRSQMSWRPRCATVPDGSKPTWLYLWHNLYLKWWYLYCFTSHVMAYWLWGLSKRVLQST